MDLPQTFNIIPNCSKCQNKVKKILSTMIGNVNNIEVENKGNVGGRVSVQSIVDPIKFAAIIEELLKGNFNGCGGPTPPPSMEEMNSHSHTPSMQENNIHVPNEQENNRHVSVRQDILKGHQGIEQLQDLVKKKMIKELELVQNLKINFSEEKNNEPSQKGCESDNKGTPPENESEAVIDSTQHGASNATNTGDISTPSHLPPSLPSFRYSSTSTPPRL